MADTPSIKQGRIKAQKNAMQAVRLLWPLTRPERPATNVARAMGTGFRPIRNEKTVRGHLYGLAMSHSVSRVGHVEDRDICERRSERHVLPHERVARVFRNRFQ